MSTSTAVSGVSVEVKGVEVTKEAAATVTEAKKEEVAAVTVAAVAVEGEDLDVQALIETLLSQDQISGANLLRNAVMIPAVTNFDDADITELEAFRVSTNLENEKSAKSGNGASAVKVTMLAFLIKACVAALKKFPEFNSSLDGDGLIYKQYWHIGFAADTPNGLVVPVIKDADQKGVLQISQEMAELAKKARDGKLGPADMSGATFTISSLGGIGGRYFTPIINAPEVAILGVCKSEMAPKWDGKQFVPRLMLPLSLTWDHRVIDGAAAARFNAFLGQILADFRRVLL
jgi:pyruvate dehydrogenase E2 component (dihydrolipoamide acetyltransferase)